LYAKIFRQIYASTLVDKWEALVTFQQILILADADGIVDIPPEAIHRVTGIPLEIIQTGISILEQPDKRSRSPEHDGCRIVRLDDHRDWGWFIPTFSKYKYLRDAETVREQNRARKQRQRDKSRDVTPGHAASRDVPDSHYTQTQTHTQTKKERGRFTPPSLQEVVDYIKEKNLRRVSANGFLNFYESKGWMVGKNKMKDWKAAVRGWEAREDADRKKTEHDPFAGAI